MSEPKVGMYYEDVRKRLKGHLGKDERLRKSLLNQAQLCEGEKAKTELEREFYKNESRSHSFSGAGHKQVGAGDGKRLGEGRWRYDSGKWIKVLR